MKIGDEVYVHGYVDEIRKDTIIIRNDGGYFGTIEEEITDNRYRNGECDGCRFDNPKVVARCEGCCRNYADGYVAKTESIVSNNDPNNAKYSCENDLKIYGQIGRRCPHCGKGIFIHTDECPYCEKPLKTDCAWK